MIKFLTLKILSFFDFLYQKKLINFLKKNVSKIDLLIDVGAHKGETLSLFLKNFDSLTISSQKFKFDFSEDPSLPKILLRMPESTGYIGVQANPKPPQPFERDHWGTQIRM